jgi:hypothetical protein
VSLGDSTDGLSWTLWDISGTRFVSAGHDIPVGSFPPGDAASAAGRTIIRHRAIETAVLFMLIPDTASGRKVFKKPSTPFA